RSHLTEDGALREMTPMVHPPDRESARVRAPQPLLVPSELLVDLTRRRVQRRLRRMPQLNVLAGLGHGVVDEIERRRARARHAAASQPIPEYRPRVLFQVW